MIPIFVVVFSKLLLFTKDYLANEEPVGYLTLQVEIFKHPGTGEYKVNVKSKSSLIITVFLILSMSGNVVNEG